MAGRKISCVDSKRRRGRGVCNGGNRSRYGYCEVTETKRRSRRKRRSAAPVEDRPD